MNYPLRYFAERIGADRVEVIFPAPAGVDPALWSPEPEVVARYQQSDLVLLDGASPAKWVERATLSRRRLVDTSAAFRDRWIPLADGVVHTHGPEGDHSHAGFAGTAWLDPELAIEQARAVERAFAAARPEHAVAFGAGREALEADLRALALRLGEAASRLAGRPLLFSHPVYPYLVRAYALDARSLHWEPDAPPDARQWRALDELLAEHPATALIWEAEPLPEVRRRLEERGLRSAVFDPAANTPAAGDFLTVMDANVAALEALSG